MEPLSLLSRLKSLRLLEISWVGLLRILMQNQISFPRISYLPFLLPRLLAFFSTSLIDPNVEAHHGWFSFEGVPLKWHYPLGLLFDLYGGADPATSKPAGQEHMSQSTILRERQHADDQYEHDDHSQEGKPASLPWRLTVHFSDWPDLDLVRLDSDGKVVHDAFINSVKEADFLRNGTAKGIMTLSKEDSFGLWQAVQDRMYLPRLRSCDTQLRRRPYPCRPRHRLTFPRRFYKIPPHQQHPPPQSIYTISKYTATNIPPFTTRFRQSISKSHTIYFPTRRIRRGRVPKLFRPLLPAADSDHRYGIQRLAPQSLSEQTIPGFGKTGAAWRCCAYECSARGTCA